eukprot:GDKI01020775.1.p1 GENE.GDKI01020775.1~~GDKI01020775.1.p1  ORF type:complete len:343 (+),score=76.79 GDKI01020775.1:263-1291(+)
MLLACKPTDTRGYTQTHTRTQSLSRAIQGTDQTYAWIEFNYTTGCGALAHGPKGGCVPPPNTRFVPIKRNPSGVFDQDFQLQEKMKRQTQLYKDECRKEEGCGEDGYGPHGSWHGVAQCQEEAECYVTGPEWYLLTAYRPYLFFSAASNISCVRRHLAEMYVHKNAHLEENNLRDTKGPPNDIIVFDGHVPKGEDKPVYGDYLRMSRYCPNAAGALSTATIRLYDAIQSLCIPVLITDDFSPPFADFLDWTQFAIFIRTAHVEHMESILRSISPENELRYRTRLLQVRRVMTWNSRVFWLFFWNQLRVDGLKRLHLQGVLEMAQQHTKQIPHMTAQSLQGFR